MERRTALDLEAFQVAKGAATGARAGEKERNHHDDFVAEILEFKLKAGRRRPGPGEAGRMTQRDSDADQMVKAYLF